MKSLKSKLTQGTWIFANNFRKRFSNSSSQCLVWFHATNQSSHRLQTKMGSASLKKQKVFVSVSGLVLTVTSGHCLPKDTSRFAVGKKNVKWRKSINERCNLTKKLKLTVRNSVLCWQDKMTGNGNRKTYLSRP